MGAVKLTVNLDDLRKEVEDFRTQCVEEMKGAARTVTQEMMDRTPVWSGKTVRNYQWGAGAAPGGQIEALGGHPPRGVSTGSMGLGEEPNRPANEAAALDDMESVLSDYDDLRKPLVVTNNSDIWDLIDNGSAPTPERARNPGGVSILAEQATKSKLEGTFR